MQLVAYGAQDVYLTGNPMITYFKVVYRRHTNFAVESIEQTFNGTPDLGSTVSALISRNGDLINSIYLQTTLPSISGAGARWVENVGHFLIKQVELEIGGQKIDTHYGDWLEIWSQLTVPAEKRMGYLEMIGEDPVDIFNRLTGLQSDLYDTDIEGRTLYIPLQFWFCRNIGLSLPLIALQYHEVKVNVAFQNFSNLVLGSAVPVNNNTLSETSLWVDYIFLDTEERRRFSQVSHEYLVEQVQFNSASISPNNHRTGTLNSSTVRLSFNHPVKELIWVIKNNGTYYTEPCNYTAVRALDSLVQRSATSVGALENLGGIRTQSQLLELIGQGCCAPPGSVNPVCTAQLLLNGQDRFGTRIGEYFNWYQTRRHTCIPASPGINVYSFSLFPEQHQPSGACNFSRIDNAYLVLTSAVFIDAEDDRQNYPGVHETQQAYNSTSSTVMVYAVNYNVLRVTSGMAGLAYNN